MSVPSATLSGCTLVEIVIFAEPSNKALPEISPDKLINLAVVKAFAVSAIPAEPAFPENVPLKPPINELAVTTLALKLPCASLLTIALNVAEDVAASKISV